MKILYSFLSFTIFISANASEFERDLTYMDYQDILQIAKLCDVAYDQTENKFKSQLEENGWDINFLPLKELPKPVGLKAHKGPLTVVAYAGTDFNNPQTIKVDFNCGRREAGTIFPFLKGLGYIHNGVSYYYDHFSSAKASSILRNGDSDQKVILAGHSLGGALAQLGGLDVYNKMIFNDGDQGFNNSCSILTLGAPTFMDEKICSVFDEIYPKFSHLRVSFENDLISKLSRGPQGSPLIIRNHNNSKGAYAQAGYEITLPSDGTLLTHSCKKYIDYLCAKPPGVTALWPNVSKEEINNILYSHNYKFNFFISDSQKKLLFQNQHNPNFDPFFQSQIQANVLALKTEYYFNNPSALQDTDEFLRLLS